MKLGSGPGVPPAVLDGEGSWFPPRPPPALCFRLASRDLATAACEEQSLACQERKSGCPHPVEWDGGDCVYGNVHADCVWLGACVCTHVQEPREQSQGWCTRASSGLPAV